VVREKFSPEEILKLAIKIEENGRNFYTFCAENVEDTKIKELLTLLAEQEKEHRVIFEKILTKEKDTFVVESYASDYEAFMGALARECIFTKNIVEEKVSEGFSSPIELLDFALRIEKDSILLYTQFMESVLKKLEFLDEIIQEEVRHFIWISRLKSRYQ